MLRDEAKKLIVRFTGMYPYDGDVFFLKCKK